jgi:hypothetical protein
MKEKRKKIQEQYSNFIDEKINQRSMEEAKVDDCKHEVAQYRILLAQAEANLKEAETRVTVTAEAIKSLKLEMQRELEDLANKKDEKPLLPLPFVPPVVPLAFPQALSTESAKPLLPSPAFSASSLSSEDLGHPIFGRRKVTTDAEKSISVFGSSKPSSTPPPPTAPFFAFSQEGGNNPFSMFSQARVQQPKSTSSPFSAFSNAAFASSPQSSSQKSPGQITNSTAAPIPPAPPSDSPSIAFIPEPMRRNFATLSLSPSEATFSTFSSPSDAVKTGGADKNENNVDIVKYSNPWATSTSSFSFGSLKSSSDATAAGFSSNSTAFNGWSYCRTDERNLFINAANPVSNLTPFAFPSSSVLSSNNINGGEKLGGGAQKQGGNSNEGFVFGNHQCNFGGGQLADKHKADGGGQMQGCGTAFSFGESKATELKAAGPVTLPAQKSTQENGVKTKYKNQAFGSGITWPSFSSPTQSIPSSSPFSFAPTNLSAPFGSTSNTTPPPPFSFLS